MIHIKLDTLDLTKIETPSKYFQLHVNFNVCEFNLKDKTTK